MAVDVAASRQWWRGGVDISSNFRDEKREMVVMGVD